LTRPYEGEGVSLLPKGNPNEIVVIAGQEISSGGRRSTIGIKISGRISLFVIGFVLGAAAMYALTQFIY
jgi:hypothetical protein